jgi:hypothetical protein
MEEQFLPDRPTPKPVQMTAPQTYRAAMGVCDGCSDERLVGGIREP